uniref:glycosyltransferase family 2 protein n=1 Tax=Algoriphagus locisalis TaxID=305507 RepID=UPI00147BB8BB|nr:glycosyltransferase family 2 protein [Algoriphagus locisalis]
MFQVSVIIPVYNVGHFVEEAVKSALTQSEVAEVILVDDGSKDNSLSVCQRLSREYERVKLFTHEGGKNLGVCQSRNLGIRMAKHKFIAFLDADDWYFPARFAKDKVLFSNPAVMAVFSVWAIHYPNGREEVFGFSDNFFEKLNSKSIKEIYCYIMTHDIILGHTNANTFRKSVFEQVGYFDDRLKLHEDTELWSRIARVCLFHPAEFSRPVSVARRHDKNTIIQRSKKSKLLFLWVWLDNIGLENLMDCELRNLVYLYARAQSNGIKSNLSRRLLFKVYMTFLIPIRNIFTRWFYKSQMKVN